jgi:streptomycin 6-kinase
VGSIGELPEPFRRNVQGAFANGAAWLDSLPSLVRECEARWKIRVAAPYSLSFNYVAPALTTGGQPVVLKLGVPNPGLSLEIQALQEFAGGAAVRLLDSDPDRGIILLERSEPGHTLASLGDDEQATRAAAEVMRELWRPLPRHTTFPTTSQRAAGLSALRETFSGGTGPFPAALVEQAEYLFRELLSSQEPSVLLHADLHHFNILAGQRRPWLAIDPKGLAGEPAYEVGALLRNPGPRMCTDAQVQGRRIEVLHEELGFTKDRMLGWGMAQAVQSAWWSFEDSGTEWQWLCACAAVLARLLAESHR